MKKQENLSHEPEASLIGEDNVARVQGLISAMRSDWERWREPLVVNKYWDDRAVRAAGLVEPNSRVLDLGCGAMSLRNHLPEGCTYIPADLVKRSEDTILIELNEGLWPNVRADVAVALGVLEYVYSLDAFFAGVKRCAPKIIFTYNVSPSSSPESLHERHRMGWLSDFSLASLIEAIENAGGRVVRLIEGAQKLHFVSYMIEASFDSSEGEPCSIHRSGDGNPTVKKAGARR